MSHYDSDNHGLFLPSKASKKRWDCVQFWKFFLSFSFFLPKKFSEAANAYYLSRLICAESEISKLVRFLIIGFHRWLLRWREASHRFSLIMKGFSNIPHYYSFWCHFVSDFIICTIKSDCYEMDFSSFNKIALRLIIATRGEVFMATQLFEHLIRFNKLGAKSRIGLCNSISLLFHVWCLQAQQRWCNLYGIKFYTQITRRCEPIWIALCSSETMFLLWQWHCQIFWKGLQQAEWHWAFDCEKNVLISDGIHSAVKKKEP